jgi:hypothetical protein
MLIFLECVGGTMYFSVSSHWFCRFHFLPINSLSLFVLLLAFATVIIRFVISLSFVSIVNELFLATNHLEEQIHVLKIGKREISHEILFVVVLNYWHIFFLFVC